MQQKFTEIVLFPTICWSLCIECHILRMQNSGLSSRVFAYKILRSWDSAKVYKKVTISNHCVSCTCINLLSNVLCSILNKSMCRNVDVMVTNSDKIHKKYLVYRTKSLCVYLCIYFFWNKFNYYPLQKVPQVWNYS